MKFELAEKMGLRGEWVVLRDVWDGTTYVTEQSLDGTTWEPFTNEHNVVSIRYIGGPKHGQVEM